MKRCAMGQGARLERDALAPALARARVSDVCARLPTEVLGDVLLLTTELVDNALWHGAGEPVLDIDIGIDSVLVAVTDSGSGTVQVAHASAWPESGHGLRIVSVLADTWGVEPLAEVPGRRVWFRIRWGEAQTASSPSAG
jgi:two-component sensor histidine kinase